jgi:hypothetical protein
MNWEKSDPSTIISSASTLGRFNRASPTVVEVVVYAAGPKRSHHAAVCLSRRKPSNYDQPQHACSTPMVYLFSSRGSRHRRRAVILRISTRPHGLLHRVGPHIDHCCDDLLGHIQNLRVHRSHSLDRFYHDRRMCLSCSRTRADQPHAPLLLCVGRRWLLFLSFQTLSRAYIGGVRTEKESIPLQ